VDGKRRLSLPFKIELWLGMGCGTEEIEVRG